MNNNIICDICNKECTSYDKGYSCRECDIDICEECVIKINKTKIMTEHKHNLKIVKSSLIKKCNKCKYQFNQNIVFFSCHSCNYNCCQFCFKKKMKDILIVQHFNLYYRRNFVLFIYLI